MNRLYDVNKFLGLCVAIALLGLGLYKGLASFDRAKRDVTRQGRKQFARRLQESADSLPPGLNGEYPSDGPLADHYRHHRAVGGEWVPVAP